MLALFCGAFLAAQLSCSSSPQVVSHGEENDRANRLLILKDMPVNHDDNCLGISAVAEALLEGSRYESADGEEAEEVAGRIFDNLTLDKQISYPSRLLLDGRAVRIESKEALSALSSQVSALYKREYIRLNESENGRQQLVAGQAHLVESAGALDAIIEGDQDRMEVFCGIGRRDFPTKPSERTDHVILIGKSKDGGLFVFDPNDPTSQLPCTLVPGSKGLMVEWSCRYPDTGEMTTQKYYLIRASDYFRTIRSLPAQK